MCLLDTRWEVKIGVVLLEDVRVYHHTVVVHPAAPPLSRGTQIVVSPPSDSSPDSVHNYVQYRNNESQNERRHGSVCTSLRMLNVFDTSQIKWLMSQHHSYHELPYVMVSRGIHGGVNRVGMKGVGLEERCT